MRPAPPRAQAACRRTHPRVEALGDKHQCGERRNPSRISIAFHVGRASVASNKEVDKQEAQGCPRMLLKLAGLGVANVNFWHLEASCLQQTATISIIPEGLKAVLQSTSRANVVRIGICCFRSKPSPARPNQAWPSPSTPSQAQPSTTKPNQAQPAEMVVNCGSVGGSE